MPLILSLKEGDTFTIDGRECVVEKILPNRHFVVHHVATDTRFEIVMDRMSEVEPDVFVSSGDRAGQHTARVVVDAPRSIRVKKDK